MTKTVIMWSGGADSTFIVDDMLRNTTDELILQHIVFKSDGVGYTTWGYILEMNKVAVAQLVALKQIADYWEREGYRTFTLEITSYKTSFQFAGHGIALPFFGARAVRKYNADRYITGAMAAQRGGESNNDFDARRRSLAAGDFKVGENPMSNRPDSPVINYVAHDGRNPRAGPAQRYGHDFHPRLQALFELEMQYDAMENSKPFNVKWEKPLLDRGWVKNDIVKHLPPELRELVVTCDYPTTCEDHWERCHKCIRCNIWRDMGGLNNLPCL